MRRGWLGLGLVLCALLPAVGFSQVSPNAAPGFRAEGVYDFSSIDQVSIFNGGLSLQLPIGGTYPVDGGMTWGLSLQYHSTFWDRHVQGGPGCPMVIRPKQLHNAGLGWRLGVDAMIAPLGPWNPTFHWIYVSPDGGEHVLYPKLHPEDSEEAVDKDKGGTPVPPGDQHVVYSRDGTYIRAIRNAIGDPWVVALPNGDLRTFTRFADDDYRLTSMVDAFGNSVIVSYDVNNLVWTFNDGHREVLVEFEDPGAGFPEQSRLVDRVRVPFFGADVDEYVDYDFTYSTVSVTPDPGDKQCVPTPYSVRMLTSLDLPEDLTFAMARHHLRGNLERLELPTGGALEWDWGVMTFPKFRTVPPNEKSDPQPYNSMLAVVTKRQHSFTNAVTGEWSYERTLSPPLAQSPGDPLPEKLTVKVTTPLNDYSNHYFSVYPSPPGILQPPAADGTEFSEYSLPYTRETADEQLFKGDWPRHLSQEIYDCAPGDVTHPTNCDLMRSVYVGYDRDFGTDVPDPTGSVVNRNRRLISQRTVYEDDDSGVFRQGGEGPHWQTENLYWFDGVGNFRSRAQHSSFGETREVETDFNPTRGIYPNSYTQPLPTDPWVHTIFDSRIARQSNGEETLEEFCFDPSDGFLLRHRIPKNLDGTRSAEDIVRRSFADGFGNVAREEWIGGDGSTLNTGNGGLCGLSLPDNRYRVHHAYQQGVAVESRYTNVGGGTGGALSFLSLDRTLDQRSGLVASTRTPTEIETTYLYDDLGRVTRIRPKGNSGAAWTKVAYHPAASDRSTAIVRDLPNGVTNNEQRLTYRKYTYDGLGRVMKETVELPGGVETDQVTTYNGNGWKKTVSTWHPSPTDETQYRDYDPFGRPQEIELPDGYQIHKGYLGVREATTQVEVGRLLTGGGSVLGPNDLVLTAPAERTEEYDAWGRLLRVLEDSEGPNSQIETYYTYDIGNRLTEAETFGGSGQLRTWAYDARGFLQSETHPEKGATGNGTVTYHQYDPFGNSQRMVDGDHDLRYSYDRASRLTAVESFVDPDLLPLKSFTYGTNSTPVADWANSQPVQITGINYLPGGEVHSFEDTLTYGGVGGQPSHRSVQWVRDGVPDICFEHSEAYTALGLRSSVTYPECDETAPGCSTQHWPRTVTSQYEKGFLTAVPDFASSISYHTNQTVAEIAHSNGVVDRWGLDPWSIGRPGSIATTSGPNLLWGTGDFEYDGAGNITAMGPNQNGSIDRYLYDSVNRLASARFWVPGDTIEGIFSDGFESGDTTRWGDASPLAGLAEVTTTQSYSYDVFGNLQEVLTDGAAVPYVTDDTTNRLTSASYDAAGNVTSYLDGDGVTVNLVYDALNRLIQRDRVGSSESWRFLYTADDERIAVIETTSGDHRWRLRDLGGLVLREFDYAPGSTASQTRDQIYRGGSLLATAEDTASAEHYSLDHLGSPRVITDASGAMVSRHAYYPFGEEATIPPPDDGPMKFTGHERDFFEDGEGNDLDYMHARYCDPVAGRFLSIDPVRSHERRAPQSWNGYSYVRNNPLGFSDPNGLFRASATLPAPPVHPAQILFDALDYLGRLVDGSISISGEDSRKLNETRDRLTRATVLADTFSDLFSASDRDERNSSIRRRQGGSNDARQEFDSVVEPDSVRETEDGRLIGTDKETGRTIILRRTDTDQASDATIEEQRTTPGGRVRSRKIRFSPEEETEEID